jgi:hypothetical protein
VVRAPAADRDPLHTRFFQLAYCDRRKIEVGGFLRQAECIPQFLPYLVTASPDMGSDRRADFARLDAEGAAENSNCGRQDMPRQSAPSGMNNAGSSCSSKEDRYAVGGKNGQRQMRHCGHQAVGPRHPAPLHGPVDNGYLSAVHLFSGHQRSGVNTPRKAEAFAHCRIAHVAQRFRGRPVRAGKFVIGKRVVFKPPHMRSPCIVQVTKYKKR